MSDYACDEDSRPRPRICFNETIESSSKSCPNVTIQSAPESCPSGTTVSASELCPNETTESASKSCPNEDNQSASRSCRDDTTDSSSRTCPDEDVQSPGKSRVEEDSRGAPVKSCYQICIEESDESSRDACVEPFAGDEPPFEIVQIELDEKLIDVKSPSGGSAGSGQARDERDFLDDLSCLPCNLPGDHRQADEPCESRSAATCDDGAERDSCASATSDGDAASPRTCSCSGASPRTCSDGDQDTARSCTCTGPCSDSAAGARPPRLVGTECTLAIIKPDGMMHLRQIERAILDEGFSVLRTRWLKLTPEQATEFYRDESERDGFAQLIAYMSSGPILVLLIGKIDAVDEWRRLIGPTKVRDARRTAPDSIRGRYGRLGDDTRNAVHGSASLEAARRETRFFFPDHVTEPIPSERDAADYVLKRINDLLIEGLVKLCECKPEDPVVWLGNWLLENNPNSPKYLRV